MQPVSRQRIGKHVPAATNMNTTIELLLETVFSTRSVQYGYKEDSWGDQVGPVRDMHTAFNLRYVYDYITNCVRNKQKSYVIMRMNRFAV
jgi:hypothetical protein